MIIRIITAISILLASTSLLANSLDHRYRKAFSVQSLSIEHGLSQSVVNGIIQDSDGYIWVATEDGLNRFNGYSFTRFYHEHDNEFSINENLVFSLFEDWNKKGLWIGTNQGVSYYDKKSGKFKNFSLNEHHTSAVVGITQISDSLLLLATDNGLIQLDKLSNQITTYRDASGKSIEDEVSSFQLDNNNVWIASLDCIYQLDLTVNKLSNLCEDLNITPHENQNIKSILKLDNVIWIGTNDGLLKLDLQSRRLYRAEEILENELTNDWVQHITSDEFGNLWIGTGSGLNKIDLRTNKVIHFKRNIHDKSSMSSDDVMFVFIDKDGLIWLGTYTGGLNILNPKKRGFVSVLTKSDTAKYGLNNTVHGITKDDKENLWIAVFGAGVFKLDLMTGELNQAYYEQDERLSLAYSLLFDHNRRLWVGTNDGLLVFSPESDFQYDLEFLIDEVPSKFYNYVFKIFESQDGKIWLATLQGLYSLERHVVEGKRLTLYLKNKLNELPFTFTDRSSSVSAIEETQDGKLWIGGTAGLALYDPVENDWRHFKYDSANEKSLSNDDVQTIYQDSRGIVWIGTSNGLNRVVQNESGDIYFERITRKNGLPNNSIYGVLEDKNGKIWLSTNQGLVRYSDFNETLQLFSYQDGISSNEFNKNAYFSDSDGLLYFGSINGVTVVTGENIEQKRESNLRFESILIGRENLNVYELNQQESPQIEANVSSQSISITIEDLYYYKLGTQTYRYRIPELDTRWNYLNRSRSFVVAGLEEGEFNIQIESKIGDEDWGDNKLSLKLVIREGFWQSTKASYLFIGLLLILIMLTVFYVRHILRTRFHKHENRLKLESIRLKEVKRQNEEFRTELAQRIIDINRLKRELAESSDKLESMSFKDSITGLYRYQMLPKMLEESMQDGELFENLNLIMLFRIKNLEQINSRYGSIGGAEARANIVNMIKNYLPANVHIANQSEDRVILFGNSIDNSELTSTLLDLQKSLEKTHISIANDKVIECEIVCAYLEIYPDKIKAIQHLKTLSDLLIELDDSIDWEIESSLLRIDLNKHINQLGNSELNVQELIDNNHITLHYL